MMTSTQILTQFFGCAHTLFVIPKDLEEKLMDLWRETLPLPIVQWYDTFYRDVFISRNGYPCHETFSYPYTEDFITSFFKEQGISADITPQPLKAPALCLSHDVDHMAPTLRLQLKTWVSQKSFKLLRFFDHYLESLEKLLQIDQTRNPGQQGEGLSTLFLAAPIRSSKITSSIAQFIVDPTYTTRHPLFHQLKNLIKQYQCTVGLHGSFFSIKEDFLGQEKKLLEEALGNEIHFSRQHWLNLPTSGSLATLSKAHFKMDSTLGWNGTYGFRGGMARPFPVILDNEAALWELPLVLMDGPLFCDLKLSTEKIVKVSQSILSEVKDRHGCVSINWHERAAHLDYNWHGAYEEILNYASANGFHFLNIDQVSRHYVT